MTSSGASRGPQGIDIHHHVLTPSYVAAAQKEAATNTEWGRAHYILTTQEVDAPVRQFACRCTEMDAAGMGTAVISVPAVVFNTPELAIEAAHRSNLELIDVARSEPDHFRVMASLPVPWTDACLDELAAVADEPLVVAIIMPASAFDWSLDDSRLRPVWAAIADLGLPALVHPSQPTWPPGFQKWKIGAGVGVPVETSLAAMHLILSGVLDTFSTLDIIVPQLGGVLPYLTQRLVDRGHGDARHDVAHYLRERLYYDNNSYHLPALRCAIETVGADRIMLGSDFPFRGTLADCVEDIALADISDSDKELILCGTARALLRNLPDVNPGAAPPGPIRASPP